MGRTHLAILGVIMPYVAAQHKWPRRAGAFPPAFAIAALATPRLFLYRPGLATDRLLGLPWRLFSLIPMRAGRKTR